MQTFGHQEVEASIIFFPKRHEGKHDRIMAPFKDYNGEICVIFCLCAIPHRLYMGFASPL